VLAWRSQARHRQTPMSKFAALPDPTAIIAFPQQVGGPGGVGTTIGSSGGGCFGGSICLFLSLSPLPSAEGRIHLGTVR
jgi:hypothetical protein